MTPPFKNRIHAGYAEVGETVEVQAPPDHDLGGSLEFTYWEDGLISLELSFDADARIDRVEIDERVVSIQLAGQYT